ncbi:PREDICTED: glutamate receptor 2.8-like [Theobroma cacao]|uniref:Glutamate receptor 2.8-like n=1 Tax=Theobroma cacao TaxID=3641 RepID=A0AB32WVB5_THECC|nr:PREDICTED: glutamate receptor 2.8-like [Theobroma cacao]
MNDEGKSNGSYNDLLHQIEHKIVDAVVGDTTIIADRTSYVDFTLPYSESGKVMVVPIKHEKSKTLWSFSYPVSWDLWLAIILSCIFFGLVIRIMERHHTANTGFGGPPRRQLGMILWFPFSSLVFPQRAAAQWLLQICAGHVVVFGIYLDAKLHSKLVFNIDSRSVAPTSVSVQKLKEKGDNVGYQNSSFVLDFLKNRLKFDESKLKPYDTVADYHKALSKGSEHNGVAAIFDEIPYIRLFLAKHGSEYMMTGPMYRTDGFGFAFPRGSALVSYISRAILKVREDTIMDNIEKKHFKHQITSLYPVAPISASSPSLCVRSFGGLFIITGIATLLALAFSEGYFSEKLVSMAKNYGRRYLSSRAPNIEIELVAHSITMVDDSAHSTNEIQNSGDSSEVFNHNEGSVHQEDAVT